MGDQLALIQKLHAEVLRLREKVATGKLISEQQEIVDEALHGDDAMEIWDMLDEHMELIYEAQARRPDYSQKYKTLVQLCATKRHYEIPPEYSGIISMDNRISWSPTDIEVARVLVAATAAEPTSCVFYADLVKRLDEVLTLARPHIYRSLKMILRDPPGRGGLVNGIRLR
jgi:hypothetical protein